MKAIILAAWKGTRLRPLTNTIPKPIIKIFWKSIIEHNLESIYKYILEITIVVKYKKELIEKKLWNNYKWVPITYHYQNDEKWTWAAIRWIDTWLDVLILNWDSIFDKKDLKKIIDYKWYATLVKKVIQPEKYWIFKVDSDNNVREIVEKPEIFIWDLANLWVYKFNSKIIDLANSIPLSSRWEYEITDAINEFVRFHPLKAIIGKKDFIDVWFPWDVISANNYFLKNLKTSEIKWEIEENVVIKWNIVLEEWAVLKSWTYIEWNVYIWKDSKIWPNTYLRDWTVIWDDCKIWNAVELKNTTVWDKTNIAHLSYIWDSVIWNNVNIGWWFISANLRHDKEIIKAMSKDILINTWLRKLWIIIWDNCKTGINTSSMPWRILENGHFTNPWTVIK